MSATTIPVLPPPFPYHGGKRAIAATLWERFGDVPNFVEPFFGSGAVLFGRPHAPHTETVNDANALLCNFWRAVQHDPKAVACYADSPCNETDLHARHRWLIGTGADRVARLVDDPDAYDAQAAGWWVWGACLWIGTGWCVTEVRKLPHLGDAGMGVHRPGQGIAEYLTAIATRLRGVRVACGDWTRVMGESVTVRHGMTAIFLDPPYVADERAAVYAHESDVAQDVAAWAAANGDNPLLRLALCGYEGNYAMPETWTCVPWKARGGYGSQGTGRGRANAAREVLWFSPHCLQPASTQLALQGVSA